VTLQSCHSVILGVVFRKSDCLCVEQSPVVGFTGSDWTAGELLQIRRLHRNHVSSILHTSTAG